MTNWGSEGIHEVQETLSLQEPGRKRAVTLGLENTTNVSHTLIKYRTLEYNGGEDYWTKLDLRAC